jgi:dTDP-glucose 4,6-dehydratase
VDAVINFAAESHVDRSILDPEAFLVTGVIGVHVLLEACRAATTRPRFLQVSTDEVYGHIETGTAAEDAPLAPRSPYAAAKAAGELLVHSYVVTHGVDAVVTRGANTYGPYHHPEKLIPLFITNALDDRPLPLYGDGLQRRDWLYVADHAAAIDFVLRHGDGGATYNVAGDAERTNRDVAALLLDRLGKPWSLVREVEDRPGHDRRYAMDGARLRELGWRPSVAFEDGLGSTIEWYRANEAWWRAARSGDWDDWYERQYGRRLANGQAAAAGPIVPGG